MEYFVVLQSYDADCVEAVVDPAVTRSQVISRIKSREYDSIIRIDHIHSGVATDVTAELIDAAEAELADPFDADDLALPASVLPPVRARIQQAMESRDGTATKRTDE